jgi:hypothetical protein
MAAKLNFMGEGNRGPRGGLLYVFHCVGCGCGHPFEVKGPANDGWTWNGSMDAPTFSPSLLCNQSNELTRCHLFVRDGKIEYQADCFHDLAGKTVDMVDWDDEAERRGWTPHG